MKPTRTVVVIERYRDREGNLREHYGHSSCGHPVHWTQADLGDIRECEDCPDMIDDSLTRYGADSNVFRTWESITPDYRSMGMPPRPDLGRPADRIRRVLVVDRITGATLLAPWIGPDGLADSQT